MQLIASTPVRRTSIRRYRCISWTPWKNRYRKSLVRSLVALIVTMEVVRLLYGPALPLKTNTRFTRESIYRMRTRQILKWNPCIYCSQSRRCPFLLQKRNRRNVRISLRNSIGKRLTRGHPETLCLGKLDKPRDRAKIGCVRRPTVVRSVRERSRINTKNDPIREAAQDSSLSHADYSMSDAINMVTEIYTWERVDRCWTSLDTQILEFAFVEMVMDVLITDPSKKNNKRNKCWTSVVTSTAISPSGSTRGHWMHPHFVLSKNIVSTDHVAIAKDNKITQTKGLPIDQISGAVGTDHLRDLDYLEIAITNARINCTLVVGYNIPLDKKIEIYVAKKAHANDQTVREDGILTSLKVVQTHVMTYLHTGDTLVNEKISVVSGTLNAPLTVNPKSQIMEIFHGRITHSDDVPIKKQQIIAEKITKNHVTATSVRIKNSGSAMPLHIPDGKMIDPIHMKEQGENEPSGIRNHPCSLVIEPQISSVKIGTPSDFAPLRSLGNQGHCSMEQSNNALDVETIGMT